MAAQRISVRWTAAFIAAALFGMSACGGNKSGDGPVDPPVDPPQVPTTMEVESSSTTGVVGKPISAPPAVVVRDAQRKGVAGVYVRFVAANAGRVVNDSARTDASGIATSGGWTLGNTAGSQSLVATSSGLPTVTFTATASPDVVQRIAAEFSNTQQTTVNTSTTLAPSVRAFDQFNNAVAGVTVNFTVVSGGGSISGAQKVTGADGVASAGGWTLGTTPGQQQARATAPDLSASVLFSAVAVAGPPQKITAQGGNNGSGVSGLPLESYGALPTVLVTDAFNNPLTGVAVTFTPGPNSGIVTGSPALTNAQGIASPTSWTLGNVASQTLIATSSVIPGTQVVFSASALVSAFDITVRYINGAPSARQQLAVSRAITKWRSVIVSNVGTSRIKLDAQNCGRNWTPAVDEMVSNVLILARIGPIDGVGGIGGDSGPCVLHNSTGLTSFGTMMFDSADLASLESSGLIDDVVAHEMGHVLGVGTLWAERNLVADLNMADPIFKGASAAQQFALLLSGYSGRPVPVENVGGPGSVGAHWRESVFRNELMTSSINSGSNPLSRVTVASLKDLGYEVSFAGADAFGVTSALRSSASPMSVLWTNDVHSTPLLSADRQGRLTRWSPLKR